MKWNSVILPVNKFAAAVLLAAAIGSAAHGQNVTASDNASEANYAGGNWTTGSNGGVGFGPWDLPGSAGTAGFNGNFIGAAAGFSNYADVYSSGVAFSIYAGGDSNAFQDAFRPFASAMSTGQVLSFSVAFSFDNGDKGFDLFSNTDGTGQVFNFNIGSTFSWTGNGSAQMTPWTGVRENGVVIHFTFTKTALGFSYTINSSQDEGLTQSGNITAAGLGSLKFYISNAGGGDGGNLFFNNLQIVGDPEPPAPPLITSAASANGTAGEDFEYQTTVTPSLPTTYSATGLPAGLSMNTSTGLISGTPSASGNSTVTIVATNSEGSSGDFTLSLEIAPPAAPSITSPWGAITVPGAAFSYQIQASPSGVPTTYNATGLPDGFAIDQTTGLITGNASSTGTLSFSVAAINEGGTSSPFLVYVYVGSAADMASNYSPDQWTEGSNLSLGVGFGNWTFTSNANAGAFLGDPFFAGITNLVAPSFGLYANPESSGASIDAARELTSPLAAGDTLSFLWGVNWDAGNPDGSKGFILYAGVDEAIVVNIGGNSTITLNSVDTGMGYGSVAMNWDFTQTTNTSVTITATPRDGISPDFTTSVPTSGPITGLKFYARDLNGGESSDNRQPYFNYLLIMPGTSPEPSAYNSWAAEYSLDPTATTGPTAGAPSADPDADSFTNQQEYAFGTNPTEATAGLLSSSSGPEGLTVVFLTRDNLDYNVQTTDNLSNTVFANNASVTASVDTSTNQEGVPAGYIRKQFTVVPSGGKNFYRVVASEQTPG